MTDSIIKVEGLSKRYFLEHQAKEGGGGVRYKRLSDVLIGVARKPFVWLSNQANRKPGNVVTRRKHEPEEFWALKDVSFDVKRGEVIGIIGRNGAGKSTLLKILSRITKPTKGRIEIDGRVASLLEVGTGFHPELTGRENVYLNGAILGMSRADIKRKFDEIVAFADVERFLDTPVKRYSSGMYVRLAFAVAAHLEPEVLIVDEVLAVGDAEFQKKCLGKMQEVSRGGRTVLFVSHNMSAVRNLCSRGLLIVKGQKEFDGVSGKAIAEYSRSGALESGLFWSRPAGLPYPRMAFESVQATISGRQPHLRLSCDVRLKAGETGAPVFISLDICDQLQTPIMQALPISQPFIPGDVGRYRLLLEVDLPPLIPGLYSLDFWIGTHFTSTVDYVRGVLTFEITDSPTENRFFPHASDHGFMVPVSRCKLI